MKKSFFRIVIYAVFCTMLLSCGSKNKEKYQGLPAELAELSQKIDKNPKDDKLYYQRADYYYNKGKIEEALKDMLEGIKLNAQNATYYVLLSDIYFAQKETDLTEENLEKAILLDPKNNEARLKLAELYFHLRMLEECITTLDEAVKSLPHNPKAHLIRAFCLKEKSDTTGYLRMLQLTIDQNPKEIKAFLELGYFYQQKLDPIGISYYLNALQVVPNDVEINYNLAKFYQDLEEFEKAIEQYNILLQINAKNQHALNNIGYIKLVHEDKYDEAIVYFTRAIEADNSYIYAICNRGIAYSLLKDYDAARQDFITCQKIDPQFEPAIEELEKLDKLK